MERRYLVVVLLGLCCVAPVVRGQGYVNIAPGKTYNRSNTPSSSYLASNAADGNTSSYFYSDSLNNPFWEVDLGRTYPVHNINVWGRYVNGGDLTPFNITVDGQHCVTVNSFQTSGRNISVKCSSLLYGQRVRLSKNTTGFTFLLLSELEILVPRGNSRCDRGRWGPQCQYYCDNNCGGCAGTNFCNQSTLNCYDDCVAGRWGDRCQNRCGQNCVTGNCDLTTGTCSVVPTRNFATSACIAGWYGDLCDTRCLSPSCLLHTCNQTTGRCLACDTGYDGDTCTDCVEGFSKHNTATCSPCSAFCNTGGCDMVTGNCTKGCRPGFHGDQCEKSCSTITSQCVQCTQSGQCTASSGHFQPPDCTEGQGETTTQQAVYESDTDKLIVPVVGSILGVGLLLTISLTAAVCWKHRSQKTDQDAETVAASPLDPVTTPKNVHTAPPTASPSISAQASDVTPHEIRDTGNTYEKLRIYSNMVFDREAH